MTCIVLTRNPSGGGVLAITEGDDGEIARWPDQADAIRDGNDHPLVKAWGGWVIDLDNLEVNEL